MSKYNLYSLICCSLFLASASWACDDVSYDKTVCAGEKKCHCTAVILGYIEPDIFGSCPSGNGTLCTLVKVADTSEACDIAEEMSHDSADSLKCGFFASAWCKGTVGTATSTSSGNCCTATTKVTCKSRFSANECQALKQDGLNCGVPEELKILDQLMTN